jgi:hypothetical protein
MHRGARDAAPRSIASFFGGGLGARSAAQLPRAHEPPPLRSDGDGNAAMHDAALPARADGDGEQDRDAFERVFGSERAAPPAPSPAAASSPPLRVFSRKRRASAPPDGCVPPAPLRARSCPYALTPLLRSCSAAPQLASPAADAPATLPATPAEAAASGAAGAAAGGSGRRLAAAPPKYKQLYLDLGQVRPPIALRN